MCKRVLHSLALAAAAILLSQTTAHAQAMRTWVASTASRGSDANACTRAAPCKTFAGALAKTVAGGEINCIDADDYGAVTITKSISIVCDNTEAGIITGAVAITVNTAAADTVTLKGIDIDGSGTGTAAVSFTQGGTLHLQKLRIRNFKGGNANRAFGINFTPTVAGAKLHLSDSIIADSGFGFGGAGIGVATQGPIVTASITNTRVENNLAGMRIFGSATTLNVTVTDSAFVGNSAGILNGAGVMMLNNIVVANNSEIGIANTGPQSTTRMGNSLVTGNATGVANQSSGVFTSYKNNQIRGNGFDGTPLPSETAE